MSALKRHVLFTLMVCLLVSQMNAQTIDPAKIDPVISSGLTTTGAADFVLIRNNTQVYENNFSINNQHIAFNTRIKISSASIWLATATVLSLADKGYFTLDTELGKLLPQFKGDKSKITVRQLLSQTSGFPTNSVHLKNRSLTLEQSVDSIARHVKLIATPGESFIYGAVGIQVAARIAEVATGKSWEQIFYEQIARPCQMNSTDFGKAKSVTVADAAYATASDYANFLKMILADGSYNGTRVLSEKMIDEMLTAHTDGLPVGYTPYKFRTSQNSRFYGLGVWIERIDPRTKKATQVSCQGARGFTPWLNTCKKTAAVFAVYGDLKSVQNVIDNLKDVIDNIYPGNCTDISTEGLPSLTAPPGTVKETDVATPGIVNITFSLDEPAFVVLKLFDPLGNEILQLVNKQMTTGDHTVPLKTKELPAGVYFYRLKVNERLETKKISIKK